MESGDILRPQREKKKKIQLKSSEEEQNKIRRKTEKQTPKKFQDVQVTRVMNPMLPWETIIRCSIWGPQERRPLDQRENVFIMEINSLIFWWRVTNNIITLPFWNSPCYFIFHFSNKINFINSNKNTNYIYIKKITKLKK